MSTQTPSTNDRPAPANQQVASRGTRNRAEPTVADITSDIGETLTAYAKKRPEVVAMWSFGIGFVMAWKLKPW